MSGADSSATIETPQDVDSKNEPLDVGREVIILQFDETIAGDKRITRDELQDITKEAIEE